MLKNILGWEKRLAGLHQTLFLYALVYEFLNLIFEEDELYTIVEKNRDTHESEGWTLVVMDIVWIIHNFVNPHFTTGTVPAVAIGILKRGLSLEQVLHFLAIV